MRFAIWTAFVFGFLIFQATLAPLIAIKGARPDLLLVLVTSAGLLYGKEMGVGIGFFCGLLQDLASGNIFGVNTLSKMAVGYGFGLAERKVFKENIFLPILALAVGTALNGALSLSFIMALGHKIDLTQAFLNIVLPTATYNMVIAIPIHQLIAKLTSKVNSHYM